MARQNFDVTEGPLLKKIIVYTIPIIFTGILQLLFNAADLMVVGSRSQIYVAAVGSTGSVTNLLVNLFMGLAGGVSVVVARTLGARDHDRTQKAVHTALPVAAICGAVLTTLGVFLASPLLTLMGTPDDVLFYSALYMRIYFCGMIPSLVYNFGAAILRAAGDTKAPLFFLVVAGITNVSLNLMFVYVFDMNVDGVATATVISQCVSAGLVIWYLSRREDSIKLHFDKLCFDKESLKEIFRIGFPAGIQSSLYNIANVLIQSSINTFGSVAMSGISAAANIEGFAYVIINAFYQTALNFTGQNVGAGKHKRVNKVFFESAACTIVAGAMIGITFNLFSKQLLSLYSITDPTALYYAQVRLFYVCCLYFMCGITDITTGVMRGIGSSTVPMIISIIGICGLRLVWVFTIFETHHTPQALFVAYPISWAVAFFAELIAYFIVRKKQKEKRLLLG